MLADFPGLLRCILAVRVPFLVWHDRQFSVAPIRARHSILTIDLCVTGFDLFRVEIVQLQRLLQHIQMLFPPCACQCFGNFFPAMLAAWFPEGGQFFRLRIPATIARMIFCPVTPITSVTAWLNWMFICSSAFCIC